MGVFGRGRLDDGGRMMAAGAAVAGPVGAPGRRERPLGGGHDTLTEVLGQKVLHGWLQNRHQVLYPLTVNLRTLEPQQVSALAGLTAVATLANRAGSDTSDVRDWFRQAGADAAGRAALDRALDAPPALNIALAAVQAPGLAAYAFVAALVAMDGRDPANQHFLDYLAVRLALPSTVVRSATRRYRR